MAQSAVIFGAGNIGRGFLGQLFSESGYRVIFVDVDGPLVAALNARRGYTIRLVDNDQVEEVLVSPAHALLAEDTEAVAQALAEADIAATAVGARVLPHIAPLVAAGIARRIADGARDALNIIVCENLKDAAAAFRQMVCERLPAGRQNDLEANAGFVDAVIGRMAPPPTSQMRAQDPSLIAVEPYKELPVDRRGFVGPVPQIVGMRPCDNFSAYTARKLYIHNCGHAVLGYLGYLRGHTFGYQALEDPLVRAMFEAALAESQAAVVAAYDVEAVWLEAHIADLTRRFANRALGDTTFRLGRDPQRKLAPNDRLVGPARLAERAGLSPDALSWGIAAGYCFDGAADPLAAALQERIAAAGLEATLADVSRIRADEPLAALVKGRYQRLRAGHWP